MHFLLSPASSSERFVPKPFYAPHCLGPPLVLVHLRLYVLPPVHWYCNPHHSPILLPSARNVVAVAVGESDFESVHGVHVVLVASPDLGRRVDARRRAAKAA